MRALLSVVVADMLGMYRHVVEFPATDRFVIIHGPNGVGKTKLLELIDAASRADVYQIAQTPFTRATFGFDDGAELVIERSRSEAKEVAESDVQIQFRLRLPGEPELQWAGDDGYALVKRIISRYGYMRPLGPDVFEDTRDGEILSRRALIDRYRRLSGGHGGARQPSRQRPDPKDDADMPASLTRFLDGFSVHLIETQRLVVRDVEPGEFETQQRVTVHKYARSLADQLQVTLARNSRESQQLDRTFPERILESRDNDVPVSDDAIRERYDGQSKLREQLAQIAVLDSVPDLPLPERELKDWERAVLWTYLNDTETKLETFVPLLERVTLLRAIINSRFRNKQLEVDLERGLYFRTSAGTLLVPGDLSSGEQHELVLVYDLLFNVHEGSLVLIDEPEISLHIGWQQKFLDDLNAIAELTSLRFIVATHSPQIVNRHWDRAVALAPDADM